MRYKVFLDDVLNPSDVLDRLSDSQYLHKYQEPNWFVARSYEDFVSIIAKNYIEKKTLEFVSFGHDLSKNTTDKTGLDCAAWLSAFSVELNQVFPTFEIHSSNPNGRNKIDSYINTFCDGYYG